MDSTSQRELAVQHDIDDVPSEPVAAAQSPSPSRDQAVAGSPVRNILSGAVISYVMMAYCLSFAALIFSGPLASGLSFGVSAALISAIVCCVAVPRFSSIPVAIAGPDTPTIAVLAAMAAAIAGAVPSDTAPAAIVATVVVALVLTTALSGFFLFTIGQLRLAAWMRFVPYPVVGGFLAASGWFLVTGAYRVMTGETLALEGAGSLFDSANAMLWGAGLAFAVLLLVLRRIVGNPMAIPVTLFLALMLVPAALLLGGVSLEQAQTAGWLFSAPQGDAVLWPWDAVADTSILTDILLPIIPEMLTVVGVTALAILLNATGFEVSQHTDVDLDAEMRASGVANVLAAPLGGLTGNLSFNRSLLNVSAGATNWISAAVCAMLCAAFLFYGQTVIQFVSAPVLGGLLFYLGTTVLWSWAVKSLDKIGLPDYLLILAILLLIIQFGYIAGAALGIVASCLFFAFNYSRVPSVRQELSRRSTASYVERSRAHNTLLQEDGERIKIWKLQGYIFFGTANRLVEQLRGALQDRHSGKTKWLLLDFKEVNGIDSSARFSFAKLNQNAEQNGYKVVLSAVSEELYETLKDEALVKTGEVDGNVFDSLDRALEWCEEDLLTHLGAEEESGAELSRWLSREFASEEIAGALAGYMEKRLCEPGTVLCRQGEPSDSFFFVVTGRVSILLEVAGRQPIRLRSMLGQTVIGEMGFYRHSLRTATVRVEEVSTIYALNRDAYEAMAENDPALVNALNVYIIRTLADRLTFANGEVAALQR